MHFSNKIGRRTLMVSMLTVFTIACGDDEVGNPTVRGDYALRTVNGAALPYVTTSAGNVKTELLDDVLSLYSGSTFSEVSHVRITTNGTVTTQTITETGTYAALGTGLLFSYNSARSSRQSVFNNRTLTFLEPGMTSAYIKD